MKQKLTEFQISNRVSDHQLDITYENNLMTVHFFWCSQPVAYEQDLIQGLTHEHESHRKSKPVFAVNFNGQGNFSLVKLHADCM